jgi:hypothetical protein
MEQQNSSAKSTTPSATSICTRTTSNSDGALLLGLRLAPIRLPLAAAFAALLGIAPQAKAADGCLVLLCFAAPSWSSIAQCVDPVRSVLDDLAHGHPFPSCGMSGAGNTANNTWSSPPDFCPPQYTTSISLESSTAYQCAYDGAVSVTIDGKLWSRTWWSLSGSTVTEFTPAAKASMGSWDTKFDDDYAGWLATQVPPAPPNTGDGG